MRPIQRITKKEELVQLLVENDVRYLLCIFFLARGLAKANVEN